MSDPERAEQPTQEPRAPSREYALSEADRAQLGLAFEIIAHLAPTLKEAELRVLIALARAFATNDHHSGRLSTRAVPELAGIAHSAARRALNSLTSRNLIAKRAGTATTSAGYALTFMRLSVGVPFRGTPPAETCGNLSLFEAQGVPLKGTPEGQNGGNPRLLEAQGVPFKGTPPPPGQSQGDAGARVDFDSISIIDRLLKANPKTFDPRELAEARRWVHGYQCKCGREKDAHPPDDKILAQILTAAPLPALIRLLQELMAERKAPGSLYSWYVTVALQRLHGIKPEALKARRAELRIARPPSPPAIAGEQQQLIEPPGAAPDPDFARRLIGDLQRKRKGTGA